MESLMGVSVRDGKVLTLHSGEKCSKMCMYFMPQFHNENGKTLLCIFYQDKNHFKNMYFCLNQCHPEQARSFLISEAQRGRAWLVLGWVL